MTVDIKLTGEKSLSRAIIYFNDGQVRTFYSFPNKDKISQEHGMGSLKRMITLKFKGKYKTALICDNITGRIIHKYVDDRREL